MTPSSRGSGSKAESTGNDQSARDEFLTDVAWADFDRRGRLLCAAEGKLFEVEQNAHSGTREWRKIADFNTNHPYSMTAPDAAKAW